MKWWPLVLVMKNNFTLEQHTFNVLYGTFVFNEQNIEEKTVAKRDVKLNYSSKSTLNEQTKSSTLISIYDDSSFLKILVKFLECQQLNVDYEDVEEKADDDLIVLITKTFTRYKARKNRVTSGFI